MQYSTPQSAPAVSVAGRLPIIAALVGLAFGTGNPSQADVLVIEQEALPQLAEIADPARTAAAWEDGEMQVVETMVISEPTDSPMWFPVMSEDSLTLSPSPARSISLQPDESGEGQGSTLTEHAVIPLPPAAWTGFAGLSALATLGWRKAIVRFFL